MDDGNRVPNFLKAAFLNVYNMTLLGGAVVTSILTADPLILVGALATEALWLTFGPEIKRFQRAVRAADTEEREKQEKARIEELLKGLPEREWQRSKSLEELRQEIVRDMQNNPSFQAIMLQTELAKLSQLHLSFVKLAAGCQRADAYMRAVDLRDLERQVTAQQRLAENATDPAVKELAEKNANVLQKRVATMGEIQAFLSRARGQMSLIENSVRLLRDQALTMTSPDQLTEQLDDLLVGVEAVSKSAQDAEAIVSGRMFEAIAPIGDDVSDSRQRTRERS